MITVKLGNDSTSQEKMARIGAGLVAEQKSENPKCP